MLEVGHLCCERKVEGDRKKRLFIFLFNVILEKMLYLKNADFAKKVVYTRTKIVHNFFIMYC